MVVVYEAASISAANIRIRSGRCRAASAEDRRRHLRLHQRQTHRGENHRMTDLTPREIVSELDRYIIGQNDAKRAVAVALRNRWRRKQLSDDLRDEVYPKNILMIGPTGVGKTEISRRLAKLNPTSVGFMAFISGSITRRPLPMAMPKAVA